MNPSQKPAFSNRKINNVYDVNFYFTITEYINIMSSLTNSELFGTSGNCICFGCNGWWLLPWTSIDCGLVWLEFSSHLISLKSAPSSFDIDSQLVTVACYMNKPNNIINILLVILLKNIEMLTNDRLDLVNRLYDIVLNIKKSFGNFCVSIFDLNSWNELKIFFFNLLITYSA